MIQPGTVVTVEFPAAYGPKRRPAVVVSTPTYHTTRPDVVLGLLTSLLTRATGPTDYTLHDWSAAGLQAASAFRAFFATLPATAVRSGK
jgi:mRNA interferase MazF